MFKKCTTYFAEKCDKKTLHPVRNINKVRRFKPLCIVEKKRYIGFWKKSSMNPTYLCLADLLETKDVNIQLNKSEYALPSKLEEKSNVIKLGNSISNTISSEQEFDYQTGDRMNLIFNFGTIEKHEVPHNELFQVLENNYLDQSHPLYLNIMYPKHPLCLVFETLSTQDDGTSERERVLSQLTNDAETSDSTITAEIRAIPWTEKKLSHTYKISPGTVLAYKCVEFKVDPNGMIILQDMPVNHEECEPTSEHAGQPECTEHHTDNIMQSVTPKAAMDKGCQSADVIGTDPADVMNADGGRTDNDQDHGDRESVGTELTEEDLEVPIIIRDINQSDPIVQINGELDPLFQAGYFNKLQTDVKLLLGDASEKDFQLIYLLLYRANLYLGSNIGDKYASFAYLDPLIENETKLTWKTIMSRIGFTVTMHFDSASVTFPNNDDKGIIESFMGVISSIINIDADARKLLPCISMDHLKIIHYVIEMKLQNVNIELKDPIFEGMISKDPVALKFLILCGFSKSSEDETMLTFETEDTYKLFDMCVVLNILCFEKKTFHMDKRRSLRLPSFRQGKLGLRKNSNESRICCNDDTEST